MWTEFEDSPELNRQKDISELFSIELDKEFLDDNSRWKSKKVETNGFYFWIHGERKVSETEDTLNFCLLGQPGDGCAFFSLLLDYRLSLHFGSDAKKENEIRAILVEYELISDKTHVAVGEAGTVDPFWLVVGAEQIPEGVERLTLRFDVSTREMLSGRKEDLHEEGPYRDFALLVQDTAFFVNVDYLADLKSSYFEAMRESRRKGVKRTVLLNRSIEDLKVFFHALCTFRKPVITCRNLELVLAQAASFKVVKALRCCEQFILSARNIHPIRKLEYAAEYGLGILGDTVVRSFGIGFNALLSLADYCQRNGESLDEMHPDVLEALDIHDTFLVF